MATVTILNGISIPADKHELVLNGSHIAEALDEAGFLDPFYELKQLNYISITAGLKELPTKFGLLHSVTTLVLHGNKLQSLPPEIGEMIKLKHLDVSSNNLTSVPDTISKLNQLSSFNVSMNNLASLPSFHQNVKLTCLNASTNKLECFPDCCYSELSLLSETVLSTNQIVCIPKDISRLLSLKILDIGSNKINDVPPEISHLLKLKELNLKGNPIKDKRLQKMINQFQGKKVIDYIRLNVGKQTGSHSERREALLSFSEDKENETNIPNEPVIKPKFLIKVLKSNCNQPVEILISPATKTVRPGIVCCVVRNINFTKETFQQFIQLQNKFHDTVCDKRNKATLGTHDLKLIKSPFTYEAKEPEDILLIPLGDRDLCTAAEFVSNKKLEIAQLKKDKKRSWNTGIYRYLHMLEGFKEYPFLIDADKNVLSLPPVINCDISKISVDTTDMLIEVTSNEKKVVREVMEKFIKEFVQLGIAKKTSKNVKESWSDSDSDCGSDDGIESSITIEQVLLSTGKGPSIRYPSDSDLKFAPASIFLRKNLKSS